MVSLSRLVFIPRGVWERKMSSTAQSPGLKYRYVIGSSVFICLLLMAPLTEAASVAVYATGYTTVTDHTNAPMLQGQLYQYNENGPLEQRWDIQRNPNPVSMTNVGTSLYVSGFGSGIINRYDFNGSFLGEFADVTSSAGRPLNLSRLESDAAGSVYAAFGGWGFPPKTSFRFSQNGNISATFSHLDLRYPAGIDASASGDVYIVDGQRSSVFKFNSSGSFINVFSLSASSSPSDIAINEVSEEMYVADDIGHSIDVYDISRGAPTYRESFPMPGNVVDVFVEPNSGRIFGSYLDGAFSVFEMSQDGTLTNQYYSFGSNATSIVAVAIPEPLSLQLVLIAAGVCLSGRLSGVGSTGWHTV